jgi:hypothetical protein
LGHQTSLPAIKGIFVYFQLFSEVSHKILQFLPLQHPPVYFVADSMAPVDTKFSMEATQKEGIAAFDCVV